MSLFDFFRNKQAELEAAKENEVINDIDIDAEEVEVPDLTVTIKFGTESVEIPLNDVQGQQLIDVVRQYESELGIDSNRISAFRSNGSTVPSDSLVEAGEYSATINAMEKASAQ